MHHHDLVVTVGFLAAFLLDLLIVWYAFSLSKRIGRDGLLSKVTIFAALSALVFGIHHILELLLEGLPYGLEIAEIAEAVAAILLAVAVYQLYKLTSI